MASGVDMVNVGAQAGTANGGSPDERSHNLLGQRLGRKGRDTRARILAAAARVLAEPHMPFSLSSVAREASVGMTTLYPYFGDLTELLLAVLEPIMASAEAAFVARLRGRWPDEAVDRESLAFVLGFHSFWDQHSRVLHLRNSHGALPDVRLARHRIESSAPLIRLLMRQMDFEVTEQASFASGVATVLVTGIERVVTVVTDADFYDVVLSEPLPVVRHMLQGQAHVLAVAIRDARMRAAAARDA